MRINNNTMHNITLFGPKHKIVKLDPEDEMKDIVVCNHCKLETEVGNIRMISGFVGCDNEIDIHGVTNTCFEHLRAKVMWAKEFDNETYKGNALYDTNWTPMVKGENSND